AEYERPVLGSVTRMDVAPRITWLFVSTSPFEVRTIPLPAAVPCPYASFVVTSTTPASSAAVEREARAASATPATASTTPSTTSARATRLRKRGRGIIAVIRAEKAVAPRREACEHRET